MNPPFYMAVATIQNCPISGHSEMSLGGAFVGSRAGAETSAIAALTGCVDEAEANFAEKGFG